MNLTIESRTTADPDPTNLFPIAIGIGAWLVLLSTFAAAAIVARQTRGPGASWRPEPPQLLLKIFRGR